MEASNSYDAGGAAGVFTGFHADTASKIIYDALSDVRESKPLVEVSKNVSSKTYDTFKTYFSVVDHAASNTFEAFVTHATIEIKAPPSSAAGEHTFNVKF